MKKLLIALTSLFIAINSFANKSMLTMSNDENFIIINQTNLPLYIKDYATDSVYCLEEPLLPNHILYIPDDDQYPSKFMAVSTNANCTNELIKVPFQVGKGIICEGENSIRCVSTNNN